MIRRITFTSVLGFLVAAAPADLFAQFGPYGNRSDSYESGADPRLRRAYREKAVATVGPGARDFVEAYGDEAVAVIFACSRPVAVKLAEFHASGEMRKLPRPRDLLRVIAQPGNGDDVALWAMHHVGELTDTDSFDAYLVRPLDYALGLKPLAAGAAEARACRLTQAAMTQAPPLSADAKLGMAVVAGFLVIIGLLLWRRKKSGIC